jgi:soluble lytic murein transglycosylase-like protein
MIRRAFIAAGAAVAAMACPALAQQSAQLATPAATSPLALENGYRRAKTSSGFQLVEHGTWPMPTPEAVEADAPIGGVHPPFRPSGHGPIAPTNFRRAAYLPHVYAAEAKYALPVGLLDALVWTESRYNPLAVSKAGAAGLGQLMPGTARELGVINRFDPLESLSGAAKYLRQMLDKFGVVHLALAAYNAGPGAVERARGIPRNGETPAYVRNVLLRWRP